VSNQNRARRIRRWLAGLACCAGVAGCETTGFGIALGPTPPPPADVVVVRGDSLVEEKPPEEGSPEAKLAGARELFRRGEYARAADVCDSLSDKDRYPEAVVLEATFLEAECYRLQNRLPRAADLYTRLLKLSPNNPYKEQALQHMFEIANYWLDDTRQQMREAREVREGKRWMTTPRFVNFDRTRPFADEEGRALEKLEQIHYFDVNGALGLGDKALFLAGAVQFFNEDYKEADHFFTQIHEHHPNSPLAAQAVELAIISKHMSTGGSDYDGRKVAEARMLVDSALRNYPELAAKKNEFLSRQLIGITVQQAEKDYKMAEFYRRTGHPGSAWFYYELVRRRYPGTRFYDRATERMIDLRAELQKSGEIAEVPPIDGAQPPAAPPAKPAPPEETLPAPRPVPPAPVAPPPGPLPPTVK
jgi:outer membrane protein assembly factor BamD (BamD/ComL family)